MVASFTFGFWAYLFTKRNYRIGGKTLLQIFPNKAHGLKQTDIYKQLTIIREFRNRIAHHEPICFNATRVIDTSYAKEHYALSFDKAHKYDWEQFGNISDKKKKLSG